MTVRGRDAAFEDRLAEARALPLEAGLLGNVVDLKCVGHERVGPCPVCGGRDRFAIYTVKHLWNCRGCVRGGKDAISLARHVGGYSFVEAVKRLTGEPRRVAAESAPPALVERDGEDDAARNLASAARIVRGILPVRGTAGERFLAKLRNIDTDSIADVLERTNAIGWHPAAYFNEPGDPQRRIPAHPLHGQRLGAIIGIMTDPVTGRPTGAISRTYLGPDGMKLGKAKTLGRPLGVVRLTPDENVSEGLHLAEGLETCLSAAALGLRPIWACGSTCIMGKFPVLAGIECLTLIADHDPGGGGKTAACKAAACWRNAGREVRILLPNKLGDLNDLGMCA